MLAYISLFLSLHDIGQGICEFFPEICGLHSLIFKLYFALELLKVEIFDFFASVHLICIFGFFLDNFDYSCLFPLYLRH